MSRITQCPACAAMVSVAQEPLRLSGGWVRCAQCHAVFDANSPRPHPQEARPVPQGEVVPAPGMVYEEPVPSFMAPQAHRRAGLLRGSKWVVALCAILLLLLGLQVLLHQRDQVAAKAPALRPLLRAGCELLGCVVHPFREAESLAIDSSAFSRLGSGVYVVHLTLKNAASYAVAMPALELTLTDAQDQAVLRRVLPAAELSAKPVLAARAELTVELPIRVTGEGLAERVAGYQLLLFYP